MNEIRRPIREADEIAAIRDAIARRSLPDFILGFDVHLGEFDGNPAAWVTFLLSGSDALEMTELERRAKELARVTQELDDDLLLEYSDRFLFYRSEYAAARS